MKFISLAIVAVFACLSSAASAATYQIDNLISGGGYSVVHDMYDWSYTYTYLQEEVGAGGTWEDDGDISFTGSAWDVDYGGLSYSASGNLDQDTVGGWLTFNFATAWGNWIETFHFAEAVYSDDPSGPNGFYNNVITLWGDNHCGTYGYEDNCFHYGMDLKIAVSSPSEVPLPASTLLLLGGMGAFAGLRRKRKS